MGHTTQEPYARLRDRYLSGKISEDEFLSQYRNIDNYEAQDWERNRSHDDEASWQNGTKPQ